MPNETLERWLHVTPQFLQLWREVFAQLYTRHGGSRRTLVKEIEICILPQLCGASRIYKNKHTYIYIYSVLFSHNNRLIICVYKLQMHRKTATTGRSSSCHMCCTLMRSYLARCVTSGVFYSHRRYMARASPPCWARCWTRDQRCFSSKTRINTYSVAMHPNRGPSSPNSLATTHRCCTHSVRQCAASAPLATMTIISI